MKGSIRSRREFDAVYTHGVRRHGRYAVLFLLPADTRAQFLGPEGADEVRLGIVASRRVGGAVQRNRAKRVLRDAARGLIDLLTPGCRMVIVARRTLVEDGVKSPAVRAELERLLQQGLRDVASSEAAS